MKNGILFDLDGTLWDSAPLIAESWNICLDRISDITKRFTADSVSKLLGKPLEVIFGEFFPELSKKEQIALMVPCLETENRYLFDHPCTLYPDSGKILRILSEKYTLGIVSNCQDGYIELYLKHCGFPELFSDVQYFDGIGKSKGENILRLMRRQNLDRCIYVGDTQGDADAAEEAGIPFIHAAYGYGNVLCCSASATSFSDLPDLILSLFSR